VKIDDHVFIAHNVEVGENTLIIACAEISGSVTIGRGVWIGPNASIRDKVTIGDKALVGLGAVVTKNVVDNAVVAGNPAKFIRNRT
jgi:UDP-3-O-[3-hydroxymyristoyl] glucosamine N-acyltransferase